MRLLGEPIPSPLFISVKRPLDEKDCLLARRAPKRVNAPSAHAIHDGVVDGEPDRIECPRCDEVAVGKAAGACDVQCGGTLLRELIHLQDIEVLPLITKQWLKEVPQPALRKMVEAASVFKHFNQETLAHVLEESVTVEQFQQLTELSFVRRVKRGWRLHDLVRSAFSQELSARSPDFYAALRRKCLMYYYHRTIRSIGKNYDIWLEASDFFHYFGDEPIRQFFNQDAAVNYFETLDEANFADAERYIKRRYETDQKHRIPYVDSTTNQTGEFVITREHNLFKRDYDQETPYGDISQA